MLNLKTRFERKRSVKNKWNVVYFGAVFFKVWAWVFAQLIFFQAPLSTFISVMFTEVLRKDLARILIYVRKIQNLGYLSKCCC